MLVRFSIEFLIVLAKNSSFQRIIVYGDVRCQIIVNVAYDVLNEVGRDVLFGEINARLKIVAKP